MTSAAQAAAPTTDRIQALDVLRGVAVTGILLANVLVFFGLFIIPQDRAAALPTASRDTIALFCDKVFVDGKFYSTFSLLFGVGFGLQLARGADAVPRFTRRLRILVGIGAVHAFLIWAGDILMLYALLGFALPWFARKSDRQLLRWTVGLLAAPTFLYMLALAGWTIAGHGAATGAAEAGPPGRILALFEAMGRGGVWDALKGNLVFVAIRWADLVATVRFPKVLGMFVLGLWVVRAGILHSLAQHRALLVRWSGIGWGLGLPLNIAAAFALLRWPYLPPSVGGLLGTVAQAGGIPLLAIGYATTVGLLMTRGSRFITVFAPLGRMALTNYLMHSIICVTLSYGFGLGLWWRIGASTAMLIAVAIIAVQIPLSAWWLSRYRFGPVEWIWRRLTYQQSLSLRSS
jgi:uncharacterized protein